MSNVYAALIRFNLNSRTFILCLVALVLSLQSKASSTILRFKLSKHPVEDVISQFEYLLSIDQDLGGEIEIQPDIIQKPISNYLNIQYFITLKFGSNSEEFKLLVDTGSSWLWIPSSEFNGKKFLRKYMCLVSTGCSILDSELKTLNYGRGQVRGPLAQDTVCLSDSKHCIQDQKFILITDQAELNGIQGDGVIGLSPREYIDEHAMLLTNLKQQGIIKERVFSISLKDKRNKHDNGELILGGIDQNIVGERLIVYEELVSETHWTINLQGIALSKLGKERKDFGKYYQGMIDSGTSCIHMPWDLYEEFIENLFEMAEITPIKSTQNLRYFWCNEKTFSKFPTLEFVIGGETFRISPESYIFYQEKDICFTMFQPAPIMNTWVLGDVFLRTVYTVFDLEKKKVGLLQQGLLEDSILMILKEFTQNNLFIIVTVGGLIGILLCRRQLSQGIQNLKIRRKVEMRKNVEMIGTLPTMDSLNGYIKDII